MATSLRVILIALCVFSLDQVLVDAKISKSMYITWGKQHATISGNGEDLQLVLDQSSGNFDAFQIQIFFSLKSFYKNKFAYTYMI